MNTAELKELAQERGLSAIKKKALSTISVLESKTGKLIGVYSSDDEAVSAILGFPVIPPIEYIPAEWTTHSQAVETHRICVNGYGPGCLCMDDTFVYLCAVSSCPNKAECNGTCRGHFSQLRVFGDLTKAAVQKTDVFHREGLILAVFPAVLPLKMIRPTNRAETTLSTGELLKATDGIIGMTVKHTGRYYVLMDKDGHVISQVESKEDLLSDEE